MTSASLIVPVVLSGGAGTRLWPVSTPEHPKQFQPLTGDDSMFRLTLRRTSDQTRFGQPVVVSAERQAALVRDQLDAEGVDQARIILEPCAKNTAPAIALAALAVSPESILLVLPSDHAITNEAAFHDAISKALPLAEKGWFVTFGIEPTGPETGYGYIQCGAAIGEGCKRVLRFREKPDTAGAREMLKEGNHVWNGGIFLFQASAYLDALERFAPDILGCAKAAFDGATRQDTVIKPQLEAMEACRADSIDYAVMEKAERVAVVPVSMGWSDIGSWDALYALAERDPGQNATSGPVRLIESWGNLVRTDGVRISAHGVNDLIIVAHGNEVIILPRGQSQHVKALATKA